MTKNKQLQKMPLFPKSHHLWRLYITELPDNKIMLPALILDLGEGFEKQLDEYIEAIKKRVKTTPATTLQGGEA